MQSRFLPIVLCACLATACAHQRPQTPDPVSLPEQFSQSGSVLAPARFWQAFADPQLDQLVEQALQRNFSLQAKREALVQAEALLRQERASFWPTLDGSLGASRSGGDDVSTETTYSGGLSASYELDLWGRVRSTADAADWDRQATAQDVRAANITLAADVTSTWYQLTGQRVLRDLQQQQIDTNDKVLQLILARFRQGQSDAADVLRQKVLLEQNRATLADYESSIAVLEHALSVLLGAVPGQQVVPAVNELPGLSALPATGLTADWLQNRPDIRSAFFAMEATDARLAAAIANRYPRLDLSASLTSSSNQASDVFDDWLHNLAANLVLPLVDGGARRAEVSRQESLFRAAFATYQQTILTAVGEVENALVQEQLQQRRIEHLQSKQALVDQVVQRLSLRYRSGAVDYLDVLDALITQQQTQQDLVSAQQQLLEYRIALARALATGWELDAETTLATAEQ